MFVDIFDISLIEHIHIVAFNILAFGSCWLFNYLTKFQLAE